MTGAGHAPGSPSRLQSVEVAAFPAAHDAQGVTQRFSRAPA
jgi:hypothetical protein